ncbi:hypothetical protein ACOMHN_023213 [Nucella lapillus]
MDAAERIHLDKRSKEANSRRPEDKLNAVSYEKDDINENRESTNNIDDAVRGVFNERTGNEDSESSPGPNKDDRGSEDVAGDPALNKDDRGSEDVAGDPALNKDDRGSEDVAGDPDLNKDDRGSEDVAGDPALNKDDKGSEDVARDPALNKDDKENTLADIGDCSEYPRSAVSPGSSWSCQQDPAPLSRSDLTPGLSPASASDPGSPVSPSQDLPSSSNHALSAESTVSSQHDPSQLDRRSVPVQSGLPPVLSQENESPETLPLESNQPDQSSRDLASQENVAGRVHVDGESGDSYKEKKEIDGVGNIVCGGDAVKDDPLLHPTDCASETVPASSLFVVEGKTNQSTNQPLTLESSVVPEELTDGREKSENRTDSSGDVISCVSSDVQTACSGEAEGEEFQQDISVLSDNAGAEASYFNYQSQSGHTEVSRTTVASSCVQQSDSSHGVGEIPVGDSCVPKSISTSDAGVVALPSCDQDTHSPVSARTKDRESCAQKLSSGLDSQSENSADCPQSIEADAPTPDGESELQESLSQEATSEEPHAPDTEQTARHQNHWDVSKSREMYPQPNSADSAEEARRNPAVVTTSSLRTSTNSASEDAGSSVDPEGDSRNLLHINVSKAPEGSESSENDFEDVTSTMVDEAERRGCRVEDPRKDLPQPGQIVSCSDEASDDDDFFDAFDDEDDDSEMALLRKDQTFRETTNSPYTSDQPADSESQSIDQTSANDFFDCQKKEALGQDENPDGHPENPGKRRPRRVCIPEKPHISLNLWSVLKNCIGKELSKIPMPVNFNEPLSMLQRLTEELEYTEIVDQAALCEDPCQQLAHVAAFTVSAYATTQFRTAKPFNPLLGETFEFDRTDDLGWRTLAEQVSHHPPTLATHTEGKGWTLWQEFTMTIKFRGRYIQITPMGMAHLKFSGSGHHYTWRKVTTTVHNIIVGRLWVDNEGVMDITNHTTGDVCTLKYQAYSYFSREPHRKVTGVVKDKKGVDHWTLSGTWCSHIEAAPVLRAPTEEEQEEKEEEEEEEEQEEESSSSSCYAGLANSSSSSSSKSKADSYITGPAQVLWKARPLPERAEKTYHFSLLAVQMNDPQDDVAPTDSRRRPDQRKMEEGDWEEANRLKFLLEEKQRAARRRRETEAEAAREQGAEAPEYQPVWFRKETDAMTGNSLHVYTGHYWRCREEQQWDNCPDIFL